MPQDTTTHPIMSQSPHYTYAQALNEAKQMIVQQQYRIKQDAEKIRAQQQTIVDQSAAMSEQDRKIREQATELQRIAGEMEALSLQLSEVSTARAQAEAVIDRQGERLTSMQAGIADLERHVAEQAEQVDALSRERDELRAQLPTRDDIEALTAMAELLSKRQAAVAKKSGAAKEQPAAKAQAPQMRLSEEDSQFNQGPQIGGEAQAEAA
jgi:predicted RNase H-like nuclease (RuvC/YqgF family)